jgi:hypothetical protein
VDNGSGTGRAPFGGALGFAGVGSVGTTLSKQHLQSADFFAVQAAAIEDANKDLGLPYSDPKYQDIACPHQAYVTGAVFAASAFLDATINQLYKDCTIEGSRIFADDVPAARKEALKAEWCRVSKSSQVMEKYKGALKGSGLTAEEKEIKTYEAARYVILLRHKLMHYTLSMSTPSEKSKAWAEDKDDQDIEKALHKFGVPLYSLGGVSLQGFPSRWLSAGCARWVVRASAAYVGDFFTRMSIVAYPYLDEIIERLR